jgi:hypothetical protein
MIDNRVSRFVRQCRRQFFVPQHASRTSGQETDGRRLERPQLGLRGRPRSAKEPGSGPRRSTEVQTNSGTSTCASVRHEGHRGPLISLIICENDREQSWYVCGRARYVRERRLRAVRTCAKKLTFNFLICGDHACDATVVLSVFGCRGRQLDPGKWTVFTFIQTTFSFYCYD